MPNAMKRKGTDFENLAVDILNKIVIGSRWKRVPGSGALGTIMHETLLNSDINGTIDSVPQKLKLEAKVGYGGKTQFALKKDWLDKVKLEADASYSIPMLIGKFSGAREGVKVFVVMDVEVFAKLMNRTTELYNEQNKS